MFCTRLWVGTIEQATYILRVEYRVLCTDFSATPGGFPSQELAVLQGNDEISRATYSVESFKRVQHFFVQTIV